jgi:EAL domain-containing protein (putative c-di-GMP-specific phosphodiesterase class I)
MVIDDLDSAAARLQVLRSLGARTAVDDFGTGHSTLAHLHQLPIDVIKIDRSFVSELGHHQRSDSIVGSLSQLAHELGATCVAEGVETEAQRAILMGHGCNLAQGYLFAHPIESLLFEKLLAGGGTLTPLRSDQEANPRR